MRDFAFTNAKVVTPAGIVDADVMVRAGKIVEVKKGASNKGKFEAVDLKGRYLLPGLIDVHVHFRTPGLTQKEDWTTGSKAALAGGVTTVLDMPNTNPPTVDEASLELKRSLVEKEALVNYGFFAGATKTNLEALKLLKNIAGIKVYMGSSTGNLLVDDLKTLEALMKYSGGSADGKILAIHAEDEVCIQRGFNAHAGETDPAVHSKIRAPQCAELAVKAALELAEKYHARVHVCHASTRGELGLIRRFKKEHPELARLVSVEVTPHHLFLNDQAYAAMENLVKVNPPLRSEDDVKALWEGIADGTVDMVATDHAPHLLEEKRLPYPQAPSGVPGVQTMLPLLLNAVNQGKLSLQKVAELCAENPAKWFGIKQKGRIEAGFDADFAVVDLDLSHQVSGEFMFTKAHWSPFEGRVLKGWPVMTFVGGEKMFEWPDRFGKILGRPVEFV